jgi:hypothetical protein
LTCEWGGITLALLAPFIRNQEKIMQEEFVPSQPQSEPTQEVMPMYEKTLAAESGISYGGLAQSAMPHRPTVTELLLHQKSALEQQLAQVNRALELAAANKGAMDLIDGIAKSGVSTRL